MSKKLLLSGQLPGVNITIHVVQDDITDQHCDAIVNTSNEELELRNAGISGAILKKGIRGVVFMNSSNIYDTNACFLTS